MTIECWVDGACKGNPGPGGWGVYVERNGTAFSSFYGGEPNTTNNRMELLSAINCLKSFPEGCELTVHTDSAYVLNGITSWIEGWKKKGWRLGANKELKNKELWQELDALNRTRKVTWKKVKGHSGDKGNDMADLLANKGVGEQVIA